MACKKNESLNQIEHHEKKTATSEPATTDLRYVLCSPFFDDVVEILPPNIDQIPIKDNFKPITQVKIRNDYFRFLWRKKWKEVFPDEIKHKQPTVSNKIKRNKNKKQKQINGVRNY